MERLGQLLISGDVDFIERVAPADLPNLSEMVLRFLDQCLTDYYT